MAKNENTGRQAEHVNRIEACQKRIGALVIAAGKDGITSEDIRDTLAVRFGRNEITIALRREKQAGGIFASRDGGAGSGGYRYRAPDVVRDPKAATVAALGELAAAESRAA